MEPRRVLFITPYPYGQAGSQRFRFEHFFRFQREWNMCFDLHPFIDESTWAVLYKKGFLFKKVYGVINGYLRRLLLLFSLHKYDLVFIHREAAPLGPPVFEWLISRVFKKKYIYDFDDAIWLANTSEHNKVIAAVKWHSKTASICKWAWKISAGNPFLADYARKYNQEVTIFPTVVDTANLHNQLHVFNTKQIRVGWTGTHSTISYLTELIPVLLRVYNQCPFELVIISDKEPEFNFPSLKFFPWQKHTEISDLNQIDIGIMPLKDDQWSKGKCGFKAIQYMSLGIPALVSPVGVNVDIVDNGQDGYWCENDTRWENQLLYLLKNNALLNAFGENAREKIISKYSVSATKDIFLTLLKA